MGMVYAPLANVVLGGVHRAQEGIASCANNAIREIGRVFGIAVLATVFSTQGGYETPQAFVAGTVPAVWVGAAVVAVGALAALALPGRRRDPRLAPALVPAVAWHGDWPSSSPPLPVRHRGSFPCGVAGRVRLSPRSALVTSDKEARR